MRGLKKFLVIKDESIIIRKAGMDTTEMDGEKVMMDLDKGEYFMMNEVGSRIWDIIQEPVSCKEVIDTLLKEYNVEESECREKAISFIRRLGEADLVSIK